MSADVDPGDLVDPIATAVQACPAVAGLHGGRFGQATTYLPGRRVTGVAVYPGEIVIGVVGRYPASVSEIAMQVRAGVAAVAPGVPVTVHVEDLALPGEDPADPATNPPPAPPGSIPTHPPVAPPRATPPQKERPS
ncbi:MAG: hypothetical protein ACRDTE_10760 [Pseudonocardiaceae bacterium]